MEGAIISLAFAVVLSIFGAVGFLMGMGFKLIKTLNDLNNSLKDKSQSEDCEKNNCEVIENSEVNKQL